MINIKTDEFYGELPGFVEYFGDFLQPWAKSLRMKEEIAKKISVSEWEKGHRLHEECVYEFSSQEKERLIFLLGVDSRALDVAIETGVHPITGLNWEKEDRVDQQRYNMLKTRNEMMIKRLRKEIKNKKD